MSVPWAGTGTNVRGGWEEEQTLRYGTSQSRERYDRPESLSTSSYVYVEVEVEVEIVRFGGAVDPGGVSSSRTSDSPTVDILSL